MAAPSTEADGESQRRDGLVAAEQPGGMSRYDPHAVSVGCGALVEPSGCDDVVVGL